MPIYFPEADEESLIPGLYGVIDVPPWEINTQRTVWLGLSGESEIAGAGSFGGRTITFEFWLYDFWTTRAQVFAALKEFDALIGTNGTLIAVNDVGFRRFQYVTFEGFRVRPETGVFFDGANRLGWMAVGDCRFRQLQPNDDEVTDGG